MVAADTAEPADSGAVLNENGGVVGISNIFHDRRFEPTVWPACVALAGSLFARAPIVGYVAAGGSPVD